MFIAALITIAKTWKQPKCPLIDEWIKMWCTYGGRSFSHKKRRKSCYCICDNMDELGGIRLSEMNQNKKEKYCRILYMESKKNRTHRNRTDWWLPEGKGGTVKGVKKV